MPGILTGKHLSRRTFLRGAGAAVSLPLLDAMIPARASASMLKSAAPTRMSFAYIPNGVILEDWGVADESGALALQKTLEPLQAVRDDIIGFSGLAQQNARALGDGGGDHARATAAFLTGVHPKKTAGADIRAAVSVDQIAAQAMGHHTRFPSLELTLEAGSLAGNCDSGYSCAYSNSMSWRNANTPNPPESKPRLVFERLFGGADANLSPEEAAKRRSRRKSLLDYVSDDAKRLRVGLGASDTRKLDEYLYALRTIERRIEFAEQNGSDVDTPSLDVPEEKPQDYSEYAKLMFDLQVLALRTDQTRIVTLLMGKEGSNRSYREIGVSGGHHGMSHHQGDKQKIADLSKINRYHAEQFAYFIQQLKAVEEGEGTMLDNCMVVYGSGIGDGNRHNHDNLPIIFAGKGGGTIRTGRHIEYPEHTPMTNLYLNMLHRMGVSIESLGDSTGALKHLEDIA